MIRMDFLINKIIEDATLASITLKVKNKKKKEID